MINNLNIYYLNLNRSKNRDIFMKNQFSKLGIIATRIEAVDGQELDQKYINNIINKLKLNNEHYTLPNKGEIGLFLTHKKLWKIISEQDNDFALILEDDLKIHSQLLNDLCDILKLLNNDEILKISMKKGFLPLKKRVLNNVKITKYLTPTFGTYCMIISKNSAKKLLNQFHDYCVPLDNLYQQVYKHKIDIWISSNKKYISLADNNLGGSTIQKTKKITFKDKLKKEFFRPIYRLKTHILNLFYTLFKI